MEIKQSTIAAVGVVSLAIGLAYIFSSKSKPKPSNSHHTAPAAQTLLELQQDDLQTITIQRQDLQKSRQLLLTLSSNINITFTPNNKLLTKKSLIQFIIQAVQCITQKQVIQFYTNNRKGRRPYLNLQNLDQIEKYFKFVCYFDNDIESMISKSHKDLAAFVNVDENIIEESLDYYLDHDEGFKNELMTVTVQLRKALKKKLKAGKETTLERCKEIIEREIEILTGDTEKLIEVLNRLDLAYEDQEFIPSFIYLYLSDEIEREFGLEEEDYEVYKRELAEADYGRGLFKKLEIAQNRLIKEIQSVFNE